MAKQLKIRGSGITKNIPLDLNRVFKLAFILLGNLIVIGSLVLGYIYLNGIKEGHTTFVDYFSTKSLNYIFLLVEMFILLAILLLYLYFENRAFVNQLDNFEMIFLSLEVTYVICYLLELYVSPYLRPVILSALLILPLTDRRTSIFLNIVACLSMFLTDTYTNAQISIYLSTSSLVSGFVCGTIGVYLMDKMFSRIKTLFRGFILVVPYVACLIVAMQEDDVVRLLDYVSSALSGFVATFLMVILLPVFEVLFNRVTTYRLSEMTRHDAPLIRKMIEIAPGTFNHSMVLSNIAEACATAIGEDALLAKACAYYHDMGKLKQPEYFAENQKGGINPHDDITPELSTSIIKSHTKDGYDLIKKYHLPTIFADVCLQHHGTMPILYFFDKAKKFTDGELAVENFLYSGPKPQTKIAAIIMIGDSSEAAVRSMRDRSRASVDSLVGKIIDERLKLGQFDECEITMRELSIVRNTIVNTLTGVYHERIEYPKINLDYLVKKSQEEKEKELEKEDQLAKEKD